jgi:hypothetical protein
MTKKQQTILLAVLASVVAIAIVTVAAGVWIFTSLVENEAMNETEASKALEEIRARFSGVTPVIELRPTGATLLRKPPDEKPPGEVKTLHVVRWSVEDERLTRVDLPFAILRLRDGLFRVQFDREAGGAKVSTSLRVADVERYGPTLLMDDALPDGGRLVMWSD